MALQLTESEERLILESRAKEKKQQQYNANAIKILEIAAEYARHCREIGYTPSFSDFGNKFDDVSWETMKKTVYE